METSSPQPPTAKPLRFIVIVAGITAIVSIGIAALLINIFEHKQEARNPFFRVVELTDTTEAPETWGKNFPMQYR